MEMTVSHLFTVILSLLCSSLCTAQFSGKNSTFQIGVVLDLNSLVGRIGLTSLLLAESDFYSDNSNFTTRVNLTVRDSKELVMEAADSVLNLLKTVKVDAIIGPQKSSQANFVISLGNFSKVPIVSFSATNPSLINPRSPYFVQTGMSDSAQVYAIAGLVHHFRWNQVVLIYEDSDYGKGIVTYLSNSLQDVNSRISYKCIIPLSASGDFLLKEMNKMKDMETRVFLVHSSSSLASQIFLKAKESEMMIEGYVWIVTSGIMDLFHMLNPQVVDAMNGVLGVKPFIPRSVLLDSVSTRWKRMFLERYPNVSGAEFGLYGLWAYDTFRALASAIEDVRIRQPTIEENNTSTSILSTGISQTGPKILNSFMEGKFEGVVGDFHIVNGHLKPSAFEIFNIVNGVDKSVGKWRTLDHYNEMGGFVNGSFSNITWPGGSLSAPKGWEIPVKGKMLRILVPSKAGFEDFVKVDKDPQTNIERFSGSCIDVFNAVMEEISYSGRFNYTSYNMDNRSYDDLFHQVAAGEFDGVVGDITITAERSELVDFTIPFAPGGITMIAPVKEDGKDNIGNNKWIIFEPFKRSLWLTTIGFIVLIGATVWLLEQKDNSHFEMLLYFPFMTLFFAQSDEIKSNFSRVVLVVWLLVVLALNSTYTASLSASITIQKLQPSVKDINQLKLENARVGCRRGSFIFEFLKELGFKSTNIIEYDSPEEMEQGLNNNSKEGGIKAFFSVAPYTKLFFNKKRKPRCKKYRTGGRVYPTEGFGFAFEKGSPLMAEVSLGVIKVTEGGKNTLIEAHWTKKQNYCEDDDEHLTENLIGLKNFYFLFGITAGLIVFCFIIYLIIYLYKNFTEIHGIWGSDSSLGSRIVQIWRHFQQRQRHGEE